MSAEIVDVCRHCGNSGVVDPELDPSPGVCHGCLNERLAAITAEATAKIADGDDAAEVVLWMERELISRAGLTPHCAHAFAYGDARPIVNAIREATRRNV